jgi:single-stranded DNA-binding protein
METKENHVQLIGYTLNEPVIISFSNGKKLARVRIKVEDSEEFNILFVDEDTESLPNHLHVGTKIALQGELVNHSYTNKEKEEKQETDILVSKLEILTQP